MMHVAAAFNKKIYSLWGNTIPEFGMTPYFGDNSEGESHIYETKDLKCRPCSKIGFKKCPKGHFNCMKAIDTKEITDSINAIN
jgi:ADP-heptose:LPS heptosyltransferase